MEQKRCVKNQEENSNNQNSNSLKHYLVYGPADIGKTSLIFGIVCEAMKQGFTINDVCFNGYETMNENMQSNLESSIKRVLRGERRLFSDKCGVLEKGGKKIAFFTWGDELKNLDDARSFADKYSCSILISAYRNSPRFRKNLFPFKDSIKIIRIFRNTKISLNAFEYVAKELLEDIVAGF